METFQVIETTANGNYRRIAKTRESRKFMTTFTKFRDMIVP